MHVLSARMQWRSDFKGSDFMPETTNLSIRIDRNLKEEADQVFNMLGMSLTTAITVFVRQAVRQKKIPFEISLYPEVDDKDISKLDMMMAVKRIQQNSVQKGTDKMTLDEINAVIEESRSARRAPKDNV